MSYKKGTSTNGDSLEYLDKCRGIEIRYSTNKPKIIVVIDNKIYTWDCKDYDKPEGFEGW